MAILDNLAKAAGPCARRAARPPRCRQRPPEKYPRGGGKAPPANEKTRFFTPALTLNNAAHDAYSGLLA